MFPSPSCISTRCRLSTHVGYTALQIGISKAKVKNVTKPQRGHYARAKVEPKKKLVEFLRQRRRGAGSRRHIVGRWT